MAVITATMENLTAEQQRQVTEIMDRENPQRRVDEIVRLAKMRRAATILHHDYIQRLINDIVVKHNHPNTPYQVAETVSNTKLEMFFDALDHDQI